MKRALQFALVLFMAAVLHGTAAAQSPTLTTDKGDYAPGEIVTITGTGWQPGETVTLQLVESPLVDTHPTLTAVADDQGTFVNNQFSPDLHDENIAFTLIATGNSSGLQAQTNFTDSITLDSVTVGSQVGSLTAGTAGSVSYSVCITDHGNNSTISFSVISGLPSGVTPSFSANNITNPPPCPTTATTLTLTTTAAVTAGTYTFTVQATGGGTVTNTGTLVVNGQSGVRRKGQTIVATLSPKDPLETIPLKPNRVKNVSRFRSHAPNLVTDLARLGKPTDARPVFRTVYEWRKAIEWVSNMEEIL